MELNGLIPQVHAAAPKLNALPDMISGVFDKIWPFIGVAIFGMFVYGGLMWLMSSGDPQRIQKAQGTMLWAVIGAAILASIMLILTILGGILGIDPGEFQRLEFN